MATTTVPVKRSAPVIVGMPDVWPSFRSEMDQRFDRFTSGFGTTPFPLSFKSSFLLPSPAVDITEDEASFKLSAELPGMPEKDIQVSLTGTTLMIKGEKRQDREETKKDHHLTERSYGEFQRSFILPESIDEEKIAASFDNGVLTVTAAKKVHAAPKKIEIKTAA